MRSISLRDRNKINTTNIDFNKTSDCWKADKTNMRIYLKKLKCETKVDYHSDGQGCASFDKRVIKTNNELDIPERYTNIFIYYDIFSNIQGSFPRYYTTRLADSTEMLDYCS